MAVPLRQVVLCLAAIALAGNAVGGDIAETILNDRSSFFYLDVGNYPQQRAGLPVGVFDSGTGGLTVLDVIVNLDAYDNRTHRPKAGGDGRRDFEAEYFIYLGDKANMPYGTYPSEGKTDLLREHILKDAWFLLGRRYYLSGADRDFKTDKPPVKAIVIACNTATAFGKADVERLIARTGLDIRIIGAIDAGAAAAMACLSPEEDVSIAVMATEGTVSSKGYVRALRARIAGAGYKGQIHIFQQAGVGLAGAIDAANECIRPGATTPAETYKGPGETNEQARIDLSIWPRYGFECDGGAMLLERDAAGIRNVQINSVENYIAYHLTALMEQVRKTPNAGKLRAIVLGCTHYPFYTEVFRARLRRLYDYHEDGAYVYRPYMAEWIELVDPAPNVARELYAFLVEKALFNAASVYDSRFFVSVPNVCNPNVCVNATGDLAYEYKYGRRAGDIQEYVKCVPFHRGLAASELAGTLAENMPLTWAMIQADAGR